MAKQVLQTLSIIIQNIASETGTYFLFSNNHINRLIGVPFDFADEEVRINQGQQREDGWSIPGVPSGCRSCPPVAYGATPWMPLS